MIGGQRVVLRPRKPAGGKKASSDRRRYERELLIARKRAEDAVQRLAEVIAAAMNSWRCFDAIEASGPLLHGAGLTFTATLPETPVHVNADASRLAQVVGNVLNNAAKFTPRGGAEGLTLEQSGEEAVIRIRDTGIGIDEGQLALVFAIKPRALCPQA